MYDNFTELMGSGCGSQSARVIESSILGDIFPKVNIVVESNLYKIIAELPGIDHKDISVSLRENFLVISGEKRLENSSNYGCCGRSELYHGVFERQFELPAEAKDREIQAKLEKGILTIRVPLAEQKAKRIEIS